MLKNFELSCPIENNNDLITLSHGSGGSQMHDLLSKTIYPFIKNKNSEQSNDAAVVEINNSKLAFTTDSFVISPLFFSGGDIGSLSVYGTVNDLAMVGATPLFLSLALIIEEGFSKEQLFKIMESIKQASKIANVEVITGDTKVVNKGKGDNLYINTSGIGIVNLDYKIHPKNISKDDVIILSGDIGRHAISILAKREGLDFEIDLESDLQPLTKYVQSLINANIKIKCLRDITRGGLAAALNEIALTAIAEIEIDESNILVNNTVFNLCEILGLDIFHLACEGRFLAVVPADYAEESLDILNKVGCEAQVIGNIKSLGISNSVVLKTKIGTRRIIDMPTGELLPRIC